MAGCFVFVLLLVLAGIGALLSHNTEAAIGLFVAAFIIFVILLYLANN